MRSEIEKLYRNYFVNQFRRLNREQFQEWFVEIMEAAFPGDFQGTRQGTLKGGGDLKVDGFRASSGTVYAVYAPRDCTLTQLHEKIEKDFHGALRNFGTLMKEWVFVHNDNQLSADTVKLLATLNDRHENVQVGKFIKENELWEIVRGLDEQTLSRLFPEVPDAPTMDRLQLADIQPVIRFIEKQPPPRDPPTDPPSPDKLEHNQLSLDSGDFLRLGRRREKLVETYFKGTADPELGESIAESFRLRYGQMKEAGWPADDILWELYAFAGGHQFRAQREQAAVWTVLTYYFERCDIFENPPEVSP